MPGALCHAVGKADALILASKARSAPPPNSPQACAVGAPATLLIAASPACLASAASKCIQLSISGADPEALTLLRDRINRVLLKHAGVGSGGGSGNGAGSGAAAPASGKPGLKQNRRPLAPRSLNTMGATAGGQAPSSSGWGSGSVISLRSGPGGGVGPAASGFSLGAAAGSRAALASSAESSAAEVGGGEDLAALSDEQQRALQLVQSGRSIFFTGAFCC